MQTPEDFYFQLIKGKIAEQIFEMMFRQSEKFTIIPFGYESILPELVHHVREGMNGLVLETVRNAPDFAVVSHHENHVFLVEVKYRAHLDIEKLSEIAEHIHKRWKVAWLFIATPDGFYFDSCTNVMKKELQPLSTSWISQELQDQYLRFLNQFIKTNGHEK